MGSSRERSARRVKDFPLRIHEASLMVSLVRRATHLSAPLHTDDAFCWIWFRDNSHSEAFDSSAMVTYSRLFLAARSDDAPPIFPRSTATATKARHRRNRDGMAHDDDDDDDELLSVTSSAAAAGGEDKESEIDDDDDDDDDDEWGELPSAVEEKSRCWTQEVLAPASTGPKKKVGSGESVPRST